MKKMNQKIISVALDPARSQSPASPKVLPEKIGSFFRVSAKETVINDGRWERIPPKWQAAINAVKANILKQSTDVHSIYIRGSVILGECSDDYSDIDVIVVTNGASTIEMTDTAAFEREFPFVNGVDLDVVALNDLSPIEDMDGHAYRVTKMRIKTQAICIHGASIEAQVPEQRLQDMIIGSFKPGLVTELERMHNSAQIKSFCQWLTKKMIRTAFELVLMRNKCMAYTRSLYLCAQEFKKVYPERTAAIDAVFGYFLNPTDSKVDIRNMAQSFGTFLLTEIAKIQKNPHALTDEDRLDIRSHFPDKTGKKGALTVIEVSSKLRRQFARTSAADPSPYEFPFRFWTNAKERASDEEVQDIGRIMKRLKDPNFPPVLLIKNSPIDREIGKTPLDSKYPSKSTHVAESWMLTVGQTVGVPCAYRGHKQEKMFNSVAPVRSMAHTSSSESSEAKLDYHTDLAFFNIRPDYVVLYCLRSQPNQDVRTYVVDINDILAELPAETIAVLRKPLFRIQVPSIYQKSQSELPHTDPLPLVDGPHPLPQIRLNSTSVLCENDEASAALKALLAKVEELRTPVLLKERDVIVMDNRRVIHMREPFDANFDGNDRWLLRLFISEQLQPVITFYSDSKGGASLELFASQLRRLNTLGSTVDLSGLSHFIFELSSLVNELQQIGIPGATLLKTIYAAYQEASAEKDRLATEYLYRNLVAQITAQMNRETWMSMQLDTATPKAMSGKALFGQLERTQGLLDQNKGDYISVLANVYKAPSPSAKKVTYLEDMSGIHSREDLQQAFDATFGKKGFVRAIHIIYNHYLTRNLLEWIPGKHGSTVLVTDRLVVRVDANRNNFYLRSSQDNSLPSNLTVGRKYSDQIGSKKDGDSSQYDMQYKIEGVLRKGLGYREYVEDFDKEAVKAQLPAKYQAMIEKGADSPDALEALWDDVSRQIIDQSRIEPLGIDKKVLIQLECRWKLRNYYQYYAPIALTLLDGSEWRLVPNERGQYPCHMLALTKDFINNEPRLLPWLQLALQEKTDNIAIGQSALTKAATIPEICHVHIVPLIYEGESYSEFYPLTHAPIRGVVAENSNLKVYELDWPGHVIRVDFFNPNQTRIETVNALIMEWIGEDAGGDREINWFVYKFQQSLSLFVDFRKGVSLNGPEYEPFWKHGYKKFVGNFAPKLRDFLPYVKTLMRDVDESKLKGLKAPVELSGRNYKPVESGDGEATRLAKLALRNHYMFENYAREREAFQCSPEGWEALVEKLKTAI